MRLCLSIYLSGDKMNDKISIIVPIYKVEKYLDKCVESLVNQTYTNLEIILVDDGSPDNCPEMCDKWAEKDSRIKVIHKPNGGLSDARNAGMKVVKGEYVAFIDSDDYVAVEFIERLYFIMQSEQSDIVECEVLKFAENENPQHSYTDCKVESFCTEKGLSLLMAEKGFHQHVWNKLYKSEIVLSVEFAKGKLNEDEFWTYQIFGKAKKVTKVDVPMYFYLQRRGSIMGTSYNIRRLDALEAKAQRQKYIEENFPELTIQAKIDLFSSCVFACQSVMKYMSGDDKKKAKDIILTYAKKYKLRRIELKQIKGNNRFWFGWACVSFNFCCKIRSVLGIGF